MKSSKYYLVISYFDQVMGPSIFYCNKNLNEFLRIELQKLLDFNTREQYFILSNDRQYSINFSFLIKSKFSRGGFEQMLISYLIDEEDIKNESLEIFKFLKSKEYMIGKMAEEIKKIEWIPLLLNRRNKIIKEMVLNQASEDYQNEFIQKYNKYFNLLYPDGSRFENEDCIYIQITCPLCKRQKKLDIPQFLGSNSNDYIRIFVPKLKICEHSFLITLNHRYQVIFYEYVDYAINEIDTDSLDIEEIDFLLSEKLFLYLEKRGTKKLIYPRKIIKHFQNHLNLKINRSYLFYLCEIVKEKFNVEINWAKEQLLEELNELCSFQ